MNLSQKLQNYFQDLRKSPADYQRRLDRMVRFQLYYWPMVSKRLWRHNPMQMSAALSYQTIFAMIPVLILTVILFKAFGVIEDSKKGLREVLQNAGITQIVVKEHSTTSQSASDENIAATNPAEVAKVNLADKIEEIFSNIEGKISLGKLGPVTIVLLIWTALALLTTMEQSLNRIFGADSNRPLAKRMMLYWSAMTLMPLLFLTGSFLSRKALAASENMFGISWFALKFTQWGGPILIGIILMTALYKYLPNIRITTRTAILGATISAPLWLCAKWGFGLYVKYAATNSIYGAAGVIPVFLFWLYISWLIFFLGAEIAYTAANLNRLKLAQEDENIELGPAELLAAAIIVGSAFQQNKAPVTIEKLADQINLSDLSLHRLMNRLSRGKIVSEVIIDSESSAFALARPTQQIPLTDILELTITKEGQLNQSHPKPAHLSENIWHSVEGVTQKIQAASGDLTLADIVKS